MLHHCLFMFVSICLVVVELLRAGVAFCPFTMALRLRLPWWSWRPPWRTRSNPLSAIRLWNKFRISWQPTGSLADLLCKSMHIWQSVGNWNETRKMAERACFLFGNVRVSWVEQSAYLRAEDSCQRLHDWLLGKNRVMITVESIRICRMCRRRPFQLYKKKIRWHAMDVRCTQHRTDPCASLLLPASIMLCFVFSGLNGLNGLNGPTWRLKIKSSICVSVCICCSIIMFETRWNEPAAWRAWGLALVLAACAMISIIMWMCQEKSSSGGSTELGDTGDTGDAQCHCPHCIYLIF